MKVPNTARKFGADPEYIFAVVNGKRCLFTVEQVATAHTRAKLQPEDVPGVWARVWGWLSNGRIAN